MHALRLPARERGIGQCEIGGDFGAFAAVLGARGGARFGRASPEIVAVMRDEDLVPAVLIFAIPAVLQRKANALRGLTGIWRALTSTGRGANR